MITRDEGFTLLEMLIALTILAMAVAGLSMTFSFANSALRRTADEVDAVASLEALHAIIGDALGQMILIGDTDLPHGDATGLTLFARPPRALGLRADAKTTFRYDSRRKRLEAVWEDETTEHPAVRRDLVDVDGAFSFAYSRTGAEWSPIWERGSQVQLVKLQVALNTSPKIWESVFTVRILNGPDCRNSKVLPCRPLQ